MPPPPCPFARAWSDLRADLDRYRVTDGRSTPANLLLSPGSVTSVVFRLSHWVWSARGPLAVAARVPLVVVQRVAEVWSGMSIAPQAEVGPGLYIGHFGGVVVTGAAVLGANCNLSQGVTIGLGGRGAGRGAPVLGDRVYVAPGAKLFGRIVLGDDVAVGANAVVTRDVPSRSVVGGVPARVISAAGSFDFVAYRGMADDPARTRSLAAAEASAG